MRLRRRAQEFASLLGAVMFGVPLLAAVVLFTPHSLAQDPPEVPEAPDYGEALYAQYKYSVSFGPPPHTVSRAEQVRIPLVIEDHSNITLSSVYQYTYLNCQVEIVERPLPPSGWSINPSPEPNCGLLGLNDVYRGEVIVNGGQLGPMPQVIHVLLTVTATVPGVGAQVINATTAVTAEPYVFFAVQPRSVPPTLAPDEIYRLPIAIQNSGNQVSLFEGRALTKDGWTAVAPQSVSVPARSEAIVNVTIQAPRNSSVLSPLSSLISVQFWEVSEPENVFSISIPVQHQGIYWDPAWIAFLLLGAILLVFLVFAVLVAKRTLEEEVLGKPAPPWKIPVEKAYLERLKARDPDEWYIVRHYLMVEEYHSALLWYHHFKRATKKDRRAERKWLKQKHGTEKTVAGLHKEEERAVRKWERKIRRVERKRDRKIRRLERKLARGHRKKERKLDKAYDKIVARIEKKHAKKVDKLMRAHEKALAKAQKRVAKENKKRQKKGEELIPEPDIPAPEIANPEIPSKEHTQPPKLEDSRYAKRAERIRRKFAKRLAKLQAKRERELASLHAKNEVRREQLQASLPPHPHTHLDDEKKFIAEEDAIIEKDQPLLRKVLGLPTLEEREERRRFKARLQWEKEQLIAEGKDPRDVMRQRREEEKQRKLREAAHEKELLAKARKERQAQRLADREAEKEAKRAAKQAHRAAHSKHKGVEAEAKAVEKARRKEERRGKESLRAERKAQKQRERLEKDALKAQAEGAPAGEPAEAEGSGKRRLGGLVGLARLGRRSKERETQATAAEGEAPEREGPGMEETRAEAKHEPAPAPETFIHERPAPEAATEPDEPEPSRKEPQPEEPKPHERPEQPAMLSGFRARMADRAAQREAARAEKEAERAARKERKRQEKVQAARREAMEAEASPEPRPATGPHEPITIDEPKEAGEAVPRSPEPPGERTDEVQRPMLPPLASPAQEEAAEADEEPESLEPLGEEPDALEPLGGPEPLESVEEPEPARDLDEEKREKLLAKVAAKEQRRHEKEARRAAKQAKKQRRLADQGAAKEPKRLGKLRAKEARARQEYAKAVQDALRATVTPPGGKEEPAEAEPDLDGPAAVSREASPKIPFTLRGRKRRPEAGAEEPGEAELERVEEPSEVPPAIAKARSAQDRQRRQALQRADREGKRAARQARKERRRRERILAKARKRMETKRDRLERDRSKAERSAARLRVDARPAHAEEAAAEVTSEPTARRPAATPPADLEPAKARRAREKKLEKLRKRQEKRRERAVRRDERTKLLEEPQLQEGPAEEPHAAATGRARGAAPVPVRVGRRAAEGGPGAEASPTRRPSDPAKAEKLRRRQERQKEAYRAKLAKRRRRMERKADLQRAPPDTRMEEAATAAKTQAALGEPEEDWEEHQADKAKRLAKLRSKARR